MLLTQMTGFDSIPDLDGDIRTCTRRDGNVFVCCQTYSVNDGKENIQTRRKWNQQRENLKTGDVVLVCDSSTCRTQWPLGLILRIFPSKDNDKVRTVEVRMVKDGKPTSLVRPISQLVSLVN